MGEAELNKKELAITIFAELIFYGNAANEILANQIALDIFTHWNEPATAIRINYEWYSVKFMINGYFVPDLTDIEVYENIDPRKNYFRIEEYE